MTHDSEADWLRRRQSMVETQIRSRGIRDERVLQAMLSLPRERFVPPVVRPDAYEDRALPIGKDQTISQPFIVAYMTELLQVSADCKVLEVGTGTGYQTAILARLAREVYSIERIEPLHQNAGELLTDLAISNVTLCTGDGSLGLSDHAPFDRILVTAGAPRVPRALLDQLVDGGRLVLPVGRTDDQSIVLVVREHGKPIETSMLACRFVRLIGREGWPGAPKE